MSSFAHTWKDAPPIKIWQPPQRRPDEIADMLMAAPNTCVHIELGGGGDRNYAGGAVSACVALLHEKPSALLSQQWHWRSQVFGEFKGVAGVLHADGVNKISIAEPGVVAGITPRVPKFEVAIVAFTRIWRDLEENAREVSYWREFHRMESGLNAYNEDWRQELSAPDEDGHVLVSPAIHFNWAAATQYLTRMRKLWAETPEGFFEAEKKKTRRKARA